MKLPVSLLTALLFTILLSRTAPAAISNTDSTLEMENAWVRVVRVHYTPHEKTAVHDHPPTPTIYVYVTDGGRLKIGHEGKDMVTRPPVKAGGIRYQKGVFERHEVEEIDGVESQYLRLELKIEQAELPQEDVRRAPADRTPYESAMLRIMRVTCPAHSACPASAHPENPAVVVAGKDYTWLPAGAAPVMNPADSPIEQVRVELKTPPAK
jgi:hypothetical protein